MVRGKTRRLNDDRFFEGKQWRYVSAHSTKKAAQAKAKNTKEKGYDLNVRVLKGPSKRYPRAKYVVYKAKRK